MKKKFPWWGYLLIPLFPVIAILFIIIFILGSIVGGITIMIADLLNKDYPNWVEKYKPSFYDY